LRFFPLPLARTPALLYNPRCLALSQARQEESIATGGTDMQPFEKLGAFYLGQEHDLSTGERLENLVMYDARDLTTHAVCLGMTGSGKTGLCIDLLEEAALDSVPAIIIDPKGDVTNLLLTFPELRPQDFQPWVNVDDARRKNMSVEEYAQFIAGLWRKGLADWQQGPERIRTLKDSADFRIYTPGSDAGLPISIVASLKAPGLSWEGNAESLREQIQGTVSALLGLVDIEADPLKNREHILLSSIFEHFWRQGKDLDLKQLISAVQSPPVRQLGVFDVDTFFPEKDRFGLAMALNNIVASPSFGTWVQGEPLDVSGLLHTPTGKPRHSIFYIAHLSDAERMFFVTLLLEQLVSWMRQQSGTTSLRALLYIDETFGYFPPVANPPSKQPLLTLLKQARAFGLGVMLTTQNPVDVDYKGLSNAGTWFIGKLQTEQDKARLLDGLQSVSAAAGGAMDRRQLDKIISGLGSRVFLMHNVHEDQPVIFYTRWAMSYLRGPLTRPQVRELMSEAKSEAGPARAEQPDTTVPAQAATPAKVATAPSAPEGYSSTPPALSPNVPQVWLPARLSASAAVSELEKQLGSRVEATESTLVYEPRLLASGEVQFVDRTRKVNEGRQVSLLMEPREVSAIVRWQDAHPTSVGIEGVEQQPEADALFALVPEELNSASKLKSLAKDFSDFLYRGQTFDLSYNPELKLYSKPSESERDFAIRAQQVAREKRDAEVGKLRKKYERQLDRLEDRLAREERELDEDQAKYQARRQEELISAGETIVGFLGILGSRRRTGLSRTATKRRLTSQAKADIEESEAEIARLKEETEELQQAFEEEATAIGDKWSATLDEIEVFAVRPRRKDVDVQIVALAWAPYWEIGHATASGRVTHDRVAAWG
jgi:hypothetical protein